MKRSIRTLSLFLCLALMFSFQAFAYGGSVIDASTASDGYFTVHYTQNSSAAMRVGVSHNGKTIYYNYTPGEATAYAFTEGDGQYGIKLYQHVSGNSYRVLANVGLNVTLTDEYAPYLISTNEITFAQDDAVGLKAAELCEGLTTDAEKIVAIHKFIASNYKYNRTFAEDVRSGKITSYTPDTNAMLDTNVGVCYDFSALFAAMCRSQGIPCAMLKGYYMNGGYHAWNMVLVDDEWVAVDLTLAVLYRKMNADELSDCTVSLKSYHGYSFNLAA